MIFESEKHRINYFKKIKRNRKIKAYYNHMNDCSDINRLEKIRILKLWLSTGKISQDYYNTALIRFDNGTR